MSTLRGEFQQNLHTETNIGPLLICTKGFSGRVFIKEINFYHGIGGKWLVGEGGRGGALVCGQMLEGGGGRYLGRAGNGFKQGRNLLKSTC